MALRGVFPNPTGTTCYVASSLQGLFQLDSVYSFLRSHVPCERGGCLLCPLRTLEAQSALPSRSVSLLDVLEPAWALRASTDPDLALMSLRAQDEAAEFLNSLFGRECLGPDFGVQHAVVAHFSSVCSCTAVRFCRDVSSVHWPYRSFVVPSLKEPPLDLAASLPHGETSDIPNTTDLCPNLACWAPLLRRHATPFHYKDGFGLQLLRARPDGSINHAAVACPKKLRLASADYVLRAVVLHRGGSPKAGHYVCHVLRCDGAVWIVFNDGDVTQQRNASTLLTTHAYLLFYQRVRDDVVAVAPTLADPLLGASLSLPEPHPDNVVPCTQHAAAECSSGHATPPKLRRSLQVSDHVDSPADGASLFQQHVDGLFQAWRQGQQPAFDCLLALPSFLPDAPAFDDNLLPRFAQGVWQTLQWQLSIEEATQISVPFYRSTYYPLAVLMEALCWCTGAPTLLALDCFTSVLTSLFHKDLAVACPPWETRARYWTAGSAAPGCGKNPALDPFREMLQSVLAEFPHLGAGDADDSFHVQQGSTHAACLDHLRAANGYLLVASSEAQPLLCPQYPVHGTWDPAKYIALNKFLDAAYGKDVEWSTMFDRKARSKPKSAPAPAQAASSAPPPASKHTNVTFALLFQDVTFRRWRAEAEHFNPIGLTPRFIFSFSSARAPADADTSSFAHAVAYPWLRNLLVAVLKSLGPDCDVALWDVPKHAPALFHKLQRQNVDFSHRTELSATARSCLVKSSWWWLQVGLFTSVLHQLWPSGVSQTLPPVPCACQLLPEALVVGIEFCWIRFMPGIAVICTISEVDHRSWMEDAHQRWVQESRAVGIDNAVAHILRRVPRRRIEEADAQFVSADYHWENIVDRMFDLGLGIVEQTGSRFTFVKTPAADLRHEVIRRLCELRVPLWVFDVHAVACPLLSTHLKKAPFADVPLASQQPPASSDLAPPAAASCKSSQLSLALPGPPQPLLLPRSPEQPCVPTSVSLKQASLPRPLALLTLLRVVALPLLTRDELRQLLKAEGPWTSFPFSLRFRWESVVRCTYLCDCHVPGCAGKYKIVYFRCSDADFAAGSLCFQVLAAHSHPESLGTTSAGPALQAQSALCTLSSGSTGSHSVQGALFVGAALTLLRDYLRSTRDPTLPGLKFALRDMPFQSMPSDRRIVQYLNRYKRSRAALDPLLPAAKDTLAEMRVCLQDFLVEDHSNRCKPFVLGEPTLSTAGF